MKLNILHAQQGYQWLHQAKNITLANRGLFIGNFFLYLAASFLALLFAQTATSILIIVIGILGVIFNMIVMIICDRTLNPTKYEHHTTLTQLWINTLKNKRILIIALITTIALTILILVLNLIAALLFPQIIQEGKQLLATLQESQQTSINLREFTKLTPYYALLQVCGILAKSIILVFFCMTPAIIYWTDVPYSRAIFYNLMGCLTNWRAWLTWAGALLFFFVVIPIISATILINIAQSGSFLSIIALFLIFILFIVFAFLSMIMIPASYYLAYNDCFIQEKQP